ncbi:MAG: 4-hydroxyphenylpyruvate dioxygenase [Cyanobacteria bacterium J06633_2]
MNVDSVTFFLDDLTTWTHWFTSVLGLTPRSTPTLGQLCSIFESHSRHDRPIASPELSRIVEQYLKQHPCGVGDVGFSVNDIEQVYDQAITAGAMPLTPIMAQWAPTGMVKQAVVSGWGDLRHTLTEYSGDNVRQPCGVSLKLCSSQGCNELTVSDERAAPFETLTPSFSQDSLPNLFGIDHVVINVQVGEMLTAAAWYEQAFGFRCQQTFSIQTPRSGLHSVVMVHPDGTATLPINEPSSAHSQIQEFLDVNRGAGVQHIALSTRDIVQTVSLLREHGVRFLHVPESYYEQLPSRLGFHSSTIHDWSAIAQHGILADWKADVSDGLLFQIFTEPIFKEPTFFFEIIQRQSYFDGAGYQQRKGFGEGNFQALFEAIEREQLKRGSLQ